MPKFTKLKEFAKRNIFTIMYIILIIIMIIYIYKNGCNNGYEDFQIDKTFMGKKIKLLCTSNTGAQYYLTYKPANKCIGIALSENECAAGIPVLTSISKYTDCANTVCGKSDIKCNTELAKCQTNNNYFTPTIIQNEDLTYNLYFSDTDFGFDIYLSQNLINSKIPKLCMNKNGAEFPYFAFDFVAVDPTKPLDNKSYIMFKNTDASNKVIENYIGKCDPNDAVNGGICVADDGNFERLCLTSDKANALIFTVVPPPPSGIN